MANLQTTCITGFLNLCQATSTPSAFCRLWFDTADEKLKYNYCASSWSTGGTLSHSRYKSSGGAGSQNSGLVWGGRCTIFPRSYMRCTEEYNGTSWSGGGALPTTGGITYVVGTGTQNAGLSAGGFFQGNIPNPNDPCNCTLEYNGSNWSVGGNMIFCKQRAMGAGTQNSTVVMGGLLRGVPTTNNTEEYNGSSWATGGNLISGRAQGGGVGSQNSALVLGGITPPDFNTKVTCTEEYNGSSWSVGGALPFGMSYAGTGGTQNQAFAGGCAFPTPNVCALEYNGTSWSSITALPVSHCSVPASGQGYSDGFIAGGDFQTGGATMTEFNKVLTTCSL